MSLLYERETKRMRKSGDKPATPAKDAGSRPAPKDGLEKRSKGDWYLMALVTIMIGAFLIRVIFAYGVSAGNGFALSGGSGASSQLQIIESILNGSFGFTDQALNYPNGSVSITPPLMGIILSVFAMLGTALGMSTGTAASATLAFAAPIFAVLTCIPVYLLGKKMFKDERTGLLAALLYAFFALMITTTVFSNGTEIAFVGFLFAFMLYFLVSAMEGCDKAQPAGIGGLFRDKGILKNLLFAGLMFAMIALSWNQFRVVLLILIFLMVAQALVDRFKSKPVLPAVGMYSIVIMLGILISAPYYVMAGLWDLIFSGPFFTALLAVGLAFFFGAIARTSWVVTIPVTAAIAAGILVGLFFIEYFNIIDINLFSPIMYGNSVYENELMIKLVSGLNRTSISLMAAFFGWLTLWLPLVMFGFMLYKYRKNADSKKYTFTIWLIFILFCIGWYSTSFAAIAGAGFAVASSALILLVIREAKLKGYFEEMRGNGIKHALRKTLKPIPLMATVGIVALILVPNAITAVDASKPTNDSDGNGYFGGLGYTIMTDDINSINKMWSETKDLDKTGALVIWMGNSTNAASNGGFQTVTDQFGNGTPTMSAVLLATSSSAATAALAIRLLMSNDVASFSSAITAAGLDYGKVSGFINDPSTAVKEIRDNIEEYKGININVTEENAVHIVLMNYMTKTTSEQKICDMYDSIRSISGNSITYVSVDRNMLPLYYRDGSYFTSVAFLGSNVLDGYGAPSNFYVYDTYSGYVSYKEAMYETFFWKSLIGMSPAEAGFGSPFDLLNALTLSDGKVKATPGYGLANYKVAYWHVYYNPDSNATVQSEGWEDMDAFEAIALQNREGGLINYVNGVVMMEYDSSMTSGVSGVVNYTSSTGPEGAQGIQVAVYEKVDYDSSGATQYIKKSTVFTNSNGEYTICVPVTGDYYVVYSSGTTTTATGSIIETRTDVKTTNPPLLIPATSLSGSIVVADDLYKQNVFVVIEGKASGMRQELSTGTGEFEFKNIIPDIYTITIYSPNGTTINSATVSVGIKDNTGYRMSATSGTITVTVTTDVGANAPKGTTVVAQDTVTGAKFTGEVDDHGKAKILVVPSTYTVYVSKEKPTDKYISVTNPTSTVSNNGNSNASLTVYEARTITMTGAPSGSPVALMSYGFITSTTTSTFNVPICGGVSNASYTGYAVSGNNVYYGITTTNSLSLTSSAGYNVSGTVKGSNGDPLAATVSFIRSTGETFVFSSDGEGKFNVKLPGGTYTLYIYGGGNALIKTETISGDIDLGEIATKKSRNLNTTVNFRTNMSATSLRGVAFIDLNMAMTIDGTDYNIKVKTDSSGKAVFTVPQGFGAKITTAGINNGVFFMRDQTWDTPAGTNDTSNTWTIAGSQSTTNLDYVKTVNVTSSVKMEITLVTGSSANPTKYTVSTSPVAVIPGEYSAVTDSTTVAVDGKVFVFPGQSGPLKFETRNVVTITLNVNDGDAVAITPIDGGWQEKVAGTNNVYIVERGKSFYFTATEPAAPGGKERIAYASVTNASSSVTLNMTDKGERSVITGYVGAVANGELTVTIGSATIPFPINDGTFEIAVPAGKALSLSAKVKQVVSPMEYTLTGSATMAASLVKDGAKINFPVTTTSSTSTLIELSGKNFNFNNGVGRFTLDVKNTGEFPVTYTITAGPAWILDRGYTITVGKGMTASIDISGRYNPRLVGAGDPDLSVTVRSINGTTLGTYVLDGSAITATAPPTETLVDRSGAPGAFADAVNSHEYMFAVTITNNDNFMKLASLTLNGTVGSNWSVVFSDQEGGNIYPVTGTNSFRVNGFSSTVIYVKLMCRDGADTNVPVIEVTVTVKSLTGAAMPVNSESKDTTITTTSVTIRNMTADQKVELKAEDMSASGNNIFNDPSAPPLITLILLAVLTVFVVIAMWSGSKRGVFSRKR